MSFPSTIRYVLLHCVFRLLSSLLSFPFPLIPPFPFSVLQYSIPLSHVQDSGEFVYSMVVDTEGVAGTEFLVRGPPPFTLLPWVP